jgi:hypothetical protein
MVFNSFVSVIFFSFQSVSFLSKYDTGIYETFPKCKNKVQFEWNWISFINLKDLLLAVSETFCKALSFAKMQSLPSLPYYRGSFKKKQMLTGT